MTPMISLLHLSLAVPALLAPQEATPYAPFVAEASEEGRRAMQTFELPPGVDIQLWAAEPRLANPVCFSIDERGDVYVAETFRHHAGVTDIREHMDWLDDDLACRSVEDRVAMFAKHLGDEFATYESEHERVRLLRDSDGDGQADFDRVFADSFSAAADGIGAGLLSYRGQVYYTCIPNLWRLHDADGDGRAEEREALSSGYGIRVALLGHDLHGLCVGPDGRLYFSCGDRGLVVTTREGRVLENWATGAVLRCELDGSDLEIFATGLRNPQELAFDDRGDLFTVDNNSDGGDRARVVHVLQGSDSGWRQAYQWITTPALRGPWNQEKLWHPANDEQPAYILPPIANLADGPSGLAVYPGTGFGERFDGRFFLADFRGGAGYSGIRSFLLEPRGAGFALAQDDQFLWKVLATDVDFGPDGAMWVLDWVEGWNKTGKGRIYRLESTQPEDRQAGAATADLLRNGMTPRPLHELTALLGHADRRVRREAQFELVARGPDGLAVLRDAADGAGTHQARLQAVWGLGMVARSQDPSAGQLLMPLLGDPDALVRATAAGVVGDLRLPYAADILAALLRDSEARVRLHAALALARIGDPTSVAPLVEMLRENDGRDRPLRSAGITALTDCADPGRLVGLISDPSPQVRLAAVVALRRHAHLGVVPFLSDPDARVVGEAARAVYDGGIEEALPALASLIAAEHALEPALMRRVLNACWRLGGEERAGQLAALALHEEVEAELRLEALDRLAHWIAPPGRDPLTGEWWPIERNPFEDERAQVYLARLTDELGAGGIGRAPAPVALAWMVLAAQYSGGSQAARLTEWALDGSLDARVRARAVRRLGRERPEGLVATLRALVFDPADEVRSAAVAVFGRVAPEQALPVIEAALERGEVEDLRGAYESLALLASSPSDARLTLELERLEAQIVPAEVALDLVQAAEQRDDPALVAALAARTRRRAAAGTAAAWLDSLYGGDAARGRELFMASAELACLRCHIVGEDDDGPLGGRVGPDLRGVAARSTRLALLESILEPNRRVAPGYEATLFLLDDDTLIEGVIQEEDGERLRLRNSDDEIVELELARVLERRRGLSAMPAGLEQFLSREQMRDLIAYLASL